MLAGLAKVPLDIVRDSRVLILGAGACVLANYILRALPVASVTAVEIDPNVIDVAKQFFQLVPDDRLHIEIGDAYDFVIRASTGHFNVVMIDISEADPSSTAPPPQFYSAEFLAALKSLTHLKGLVAFNTVKAEGSTMKSAFKNAFQTVLSSKCTEEKNEVFCLYSAPPTANSESLLPESVKEFVGDLQPLKKKRKRANKKKK
mmetsp:Transcript_23893/g.42299  ORF Transcript_23893/g.42299 Transcript_23893/m.42299 type:complete len:203 (+) Transcript_23893:634-1242(+)